MGSSFKSNSGSIERANLDGSDRRVVVPVGTSGVFTPKQITIAKRSQKLYWCDREGMKVMRANLDGSEVETLISTGNTEADMLDQSRWCVGIAVDERRGLFYWTQKGPSKGNQGRILRAPIEPASGASELVRDIEVVFEKLPEPIDLEFDEEITGHVADKVASAALAVPEFFSAALNRVIESRRRFSAILQRFRSFQDVAGDSQHAYFISVLEKVRETFKSHIGSFDTSGLRSALPTDEVKNDDKHNARLRTGNMFESLSVYEPSDEFLSAPDAVFPSLDDVQYAAEEEDTQTESLFILSTLLADFFKLREEVFGLWQQYQAGSRDLAAVAVATNTAIKLAHSMEDEVSTQLKKLGGVEELIPMVFGGACAARGLHPEDKRQPTDDYNYRCYAEANMFFYNTLCLLNAYKGQGLSDTCPSYNGKFGWYRDDRKAGDDRERWQEDKAALLELFADMHVIVTTLKGIQVQDEFVKGFKQMMQTKKIPGVWLAFGAQIYLDILKSLGSEVRRGEEYLKRITNSIGDVVREAPELKKSRHFKEAIDDLLMSVDQWSSDKDIFNIIRQVSGLPTRPSNFLSHNPMFCGLHVHDIRTAFHRLGIEFASKGNLMHAVQLYQALRQEGILEEQEKRADLEFIMKIQGNSAFFVGNSPTSLEAYSKNFALTKGISATHWLPNRSTKNKKIPMSRAGIRTINYQARASMAFAQTFLVDSDSRGLNVEVADLILDSSGWYKKHDSDGIRELESASTNDEKDSIKNKRKVRDNSI
ncbi:hypothetical protein K4K61_005926 [Colletotrichum sp. SAR11_59]|nr:hypothetical protein K4K61_005926 [Colletotrichum sp. SAR11_59]